MDKKRILEKLGGILTDLHSQQQFLLENTDMLNQVEAALFSANASYLADYAAILEKMTAPPAQGTQGAVAVPPVLRKDPDEPDDDIGFRLGHEEKGLRGTAPAENFSLLEDPASEEDAVSAEDPVFDEDPASEGSTASGEDVASGKSPASDRDSDLPDGSVLGGPVLSEGPARQESDSPRESGSPGKPRSSEEPPSPKGSHSPQESDSPQEPQTAQGPSAAQEGPDRQKPAAGSGIEAAEGQAAAASEEPLPRDELFTQDKETFPRTESTSGQDEDAPQDTPARQEIPGTFRDADPGIQEEADSGAQGKEQPGVQEAQPGKEGSGRRLSLNERFQERKTSLYDKIASGQAGKDPQADKPISNLGRSIGINERYYFIKTLFNDDKVAFDQAITRVDMCHSLGEALEYVNKSLSGRYGWSRKEEDSRKFYDLLKRRFI